MDIIGGLAGLSIGVSFKTQGNLLLATANLGNASDDRVLADLVKLFDLGVDAIACQEAGDRGRVLTRLAKIRADVEFWDGDGSPGAASTPVVWSTRRLTATRKITVPLTGRKHVGNPGAGPAWVKAKVLNVVLFQHAETEALFWFGSMHIVASVRIPIRRGVARRQVQGAADWVVLQTIPVWIGADWNMPAHHKLMAPLRGAGLKPGPDVVTHGRRSEIDRIWGPTVPVEQRTVSTSSDHQALVDAYTITKGDPVTKHGFMPGVIDREIPPGANDPEIIPVGGVLHVRDGLGPSLHDFFDGPSGGIESTWYVRFDGTIEQYRSIYREADANFKGNSFIRNGKRCGLLSIETEGLAAGEWTAAQLASIKRIILWANKEAGVAIKVIDRWDGDGWGYHIMFGTPGPWTPRVKSCPGPDRIKQFFAVFVPWLKAGGKDPAPKPRLLDSIRADLKVALARAEAHGKTAKAAMIRAALTALGGKP